MFLTKGRVTLLMLLCMLMIHSSQIYASNSLNSETETETEESKPTLKLKGFLRYNYTVSSWKPEMKERGGEFGYDVLALGAVAQHKDIYLDFDYRFYAAAYGSFLKYGYIGYNMTEQDNFQIGLAMVPFGITQYNSNSYFFGLPCYLGFEDEYDMGIKYSHTSENWDYNFAFFKNAEEFSYSDNADLKYSRYGYDVVSIDLDGDGVTEHRNKEINQLNAQLFYKTESEDSKHRVGASAQYSGIYNLDTKETGNHYAMALHYDATISNFSIMAQAMTYNYNLEAPEGEADNVMALGAYGFAYLASSSASVYTLNLGYNVIIKNSIVNSIKFYNDFGYMNKGEDLFEDTFMNVTGASIVAGGAFIYVDYAMGKNHSWLGTDWTNALAAGIEDSDWESRFNISVGYYF